jgi:hypothetical protein
MRPLFPSSDELGYESAALRARDEETRSLRRTNVLA